MLAFHDLFAHVRSKISESMFGPVWEPLGSDTYMSAAAGQPPVGRLSNEDLGEQIKRFRSSSMYSDYGSAGASFAGEAARPTHISARDSVRACIVPWFSYLHLEPLTEDDNVECASVKSGVLDSTAVAYVLNQSYSL